MAAVGEARQHYDAGQDLLARSAREGLNVAYRTLLATQAIARFTAAAALTEVHRERAREQLDDARAEHVERWNAVIENSTHTLKQIEEDTDARRGTDETNPGAH